MQKNDTFFNFLLMFPIVRNNSNAEKSLGIVALDHVLLTTIACQSK